MGVANRDYMRDPEESASSRWLGPVIAVLAVVAVLLYFRRGAWVPPAEEWPKPKLLASQTIPLGYFEIVSGELAVCDPGYDRQLVTKGGIAVKVGNVPNGNWEARVVQHTIDRADHVRCAELIAFPAAAPPPEGAPWKVLHADIGVDSGQAGFFDWRHVFAADVVPRDHPWRGRMLIPENPWYSLCCEATLYGRHHAGIIPYGVVASSGWGDGGYPLYHLRDARGNVTGLRLVFITEDEYQREDKPAPGTAKERKPERE